jgi:hypothetical protein
MPPQGCRVGRDSLRTGKVGTRTVAARFKFFFHDNRRSVTLQRMPGEVFGNPSLKGNLMSMSCVVYYSPIPQLVKNIIYILNKCSRV